MRSGLVRDGMKWGFAGRGSETSPFRFLGPAVLARLFFFPFSCAGVLVATNPGNSEGCQGFRVESAEARHHCLRSSAEPQEALLVPHHGAARALTLLSLTP